MVNEGNEPLCTTVTLPTRAKIGAYDLWDNTARQQPCAQVENGMQFTLELPVRGSRLYFACTEDEFLALPALSGICELPVPAFTLLRHDPARVQKVYHATLAVTPAQLAQGRLRLTVHAEEMAELTVNGTAVGAAFWPPQQFYLEGALRPGNNELLLTVTGSLANLYGERPVPYGLKTE